MPRNAPLYGSQRRDGLSDIGRLEWERPRFDYRECHSNRGSRAGLDMFAA